MTAATSAARVIVVGGGLAGLSAALRVAEAGARCDLFSVVPCRRSGAVIAQEGLPAFESPRRHFEETIVAGDFLANQAPVHFLCEAAPGVVNLLDRMGVPFARTPEGRVDPASVAGRPILYALDDQVRRAEGEGKIGRFEGWEFLSAVLDDAHRCRGIVAMDVASGEIRAFPADAVILATGGPGLVFGRSTMARAATGAAAAAVYRQGAAYANGEFIQVHPTAIPGHDKNRAVSGAVRRAGGRIWTYRDGKPWYFLEEKYPRVGNLVPGDVAAREIFHVVHEMGLGIDGEPVVHLDATGIPPVRLADLAGALEVYEKFGGDDPRRAPMRVFPSVHASLGGLSTDGSVGGDRDGMTSIRGLFAAGGCACAFHGASRLDGNALLSSIYSGLLAGPASVKYASGLTAADAAGAPLERLLDRERERAEARFAGIRHRSGAEDLFKIHDELGEGMTRHASVVRRNADLAALDAKLVELAERQKRAPVPDASRIHNDSLRFAGHVELALDLARAIVQGALRRDESRGAHWKPEFPARDDARFLKTTLARWTAAGPEIRHEAVDTALLAPRPRKVD